MRLHSHPFSIIFLVVVRIVFENGATGDVNFYIFVSDIRWLSPELAWSLCDYADMLSERNNEGDRQKAMQLLDESLQISRELGMQSFMERVLSRREILKA